MLNIETPLKRGCIFFGISYLSRQNIFVRWCLFIIFPSFYSIIPLCLLTTVNEEVTAFSVFHDAWETGAGNCIARGGSLQIRVRWRNSPLARSALSFPGETSGLNTGNGGRRQMPKGCVTIQPHGYKQGRGTGGSAGSRWRGWRDGLSQEMWYSPSQGEEERHFPYAWIGKIHWSGWFWSLFSYFG